jgi:hypothetical protein
MTLEFKALDNTTATAQGYWKINLLSMVSRAKDRTGDHVTTEAMDT